MADIPIIYTWDGERMEPLRRFANVCDRQFTIGETYCLIQHEHRSQASHNQFFAIVHRAWENLPEHLAERFPTAEHLRKYALIKAGYRDERTIVAASKAEAQRLAAFVRPMDEYAVVTVSEAVVSVYTAQSQSMKSMGKQRFQASKDAVLAVLAEMIGVSPETLIGVSHAA